MKTQLITLAFLLSVGFAGAMAQTEKPAFPFDRPIDPLSAGASDASRDAFNPLRTGRPTPQGLEATGAPHRRFVSPQSNFFYLVDTAIVRSPHDTARHLYSFDEFAKRILDVTQKWKDGLWEDSLRETSTYSPNHNVLLTAETQTWADGEWSNSERRVYTYSPTAKKTSEVLEYWGDGQWEGYYRSGYTYELTGKLQSTWTEQRWDSVHWENDERHTYTYDAHGHKLSDLYEKGSGSDWVPFTRLSYTFDGNGNRLTQLYETWSGAWENSSRSTCTYDANGNKQTELWENWVLSQWENASRQTNTYAPSRKVLTSLREDWISDQWTNVYFTTYTYDAYLNPSLRFVQAWKDSQWINSALAETSYDSKGRLLTYAFEYWHNDQWTKVERFTYAYDVFSNLLSSLYEEGSGSDWVNVWQRIHTYDGGGRLTTAWHYVWNGSEWIPTHDPQYWEVVDDGENAYYYQGYAVTLTYWLLLTDVLPGGQDVPAIYTLSQNYPNPFNPSTTIRYGLPARAAVTLNVFNTLGQRVAVLVNGEVEAGYHEVKFDPSGLSSGVYFYQLQAGGFVQTRKLLLVR